MFTEQFRVLEALSKPRTRQELAQRLDYSPNTVTNAIGKLESQGLVSRERTGQQTRVSPTEVQCVETYQSLVSTHPHIDFPALFTKSLLELLYYLSSGSWTTAATLIETSTLTKSTVYRHLNTLQNRAIVLKKHSQYRLADEFEGLHTFARELRHHHHRQQVKTDAPGGVLVWETYDEFLVRTTEPVSKEGYHQTGLDAFSEYGLEFFTTSEQYYFFAPDRASLRPADISCHLLVIENDARHRKYAMLLLVATDEPLETVREKASYYGVAETVAAMAEYVDTEGDVQAETLPPWGEFESLAADYGVSV
jgi:DNA-binding MarR family transcriptional regulator